MDTEIFAQRMIELLPQFMRVFARHEHNDFTSGKITLPQFWALDFLYRAGAAKMSGLAQYLNVSPASATGLIDRLITQKLVVRKYDPNDRRVVEIELSLKGKGMIENIRKQKIQALTKIFGKVSSEDRAKYLEILDKVITTAK